MVWVGPALFVYGLQWGSWGYDAYMNCLIFDKVGAKLDKYKFVEYLKKKILLLLFYWKKCLSQNIYIFLNIFFEGTVGVK